MTLVGKSAPLFTLPAVINGTEIVDQFSIKDIIGKKNILLFFYPQDFSAICPMELLEFQKNLAGFEKRNVQLIGCSTDSAAVHKIWLQTPVEAGGIKGVTYPLIADMAKTVATNYGVLAGNYDYNEAGELLFEGAPVALRGSFFIDTSGIVRHEQVSFFTLVRSIKDTLRVIDYWQYFEEHGEACPVNHAQDS